MAKAKKRGTRRPKGMKKASRKTRVKAKGKGKAKRRVSFPKLWQRLGNAVLRSAGKDRKVFVANLAGDAELQRCIVERAVRLLSARASEIASAVPVREPAPESREESVSDDYALASRAADACFAEQGCETPVPAEEKSDWRVF